MLNHPEILEKAITELDIIVGKDRLVQESDIPQLNYIKACSRESFRLHPVNAFMPPHGAIENTTLAGYFIPKGNNNNNSKENNISHVDDMHAWIESDIAQKLLEFFFFFLN